MQPRREFRALAFALLAYAAFFAAVFAQAIRGSNYIAPSDSLDFGVAAFLSDFALWTDGMFSGYPVAADPQALTWYPLFQLFRAAGLGWNAFMVTPYILASAGCFLLVRRLTRSSLAGAFSGFAYGFSGVMLAHISHFNQIHAAAWLPLVVYGLQLVREEHYRAGALVAAASYGLMWTAGHPQVAVYTFYVAIAAVGCCLWLDRPWWRVCRTRLLWSAVALAAGLALAALVILPMVELGGLSRRSGDTWELYVSKALPLRQLLSLVLPLAFGGFLAPDGTRVPWVGESSPGEMTGYVGLLPLALALAGPLLIPGVRRDARVWLGLAVVAALLCLGAQTPIGRAFYYVPGYDAFRVPARHLFVLTFAIAVSAGLAFEPLARDRATARRIAIALLLVVGAGLGAAWVWLRTDPDVRPLWEGTDAYASWALRWPLAVAGIMALLALAGGVRWAPAASAAVILLTLHVGEMAAFHYLMPGYRFVYAEVPPERVAPHPRIAALGRELRAAGYRVLAADGSRNRFLLPNFPRAWNVPAASGTGSLGMEHYLDLFRMGGPGDVADEVLAGENRAPDMFGIRYVFVRQASALDAALREQRGRWSAVEELRYAEHDPDTAYTVFRNERALPRAWCARRVIGVAGREALAIVRGGHLTNGRGEFDPRTTALVERGSVAEGSFAGADVTTMPRTGEYRYLVSSSSPCFLVLSEVHHPWWRATIDGEPAAVVRANHAMVGVMVPPGAHVVRLSLRPVSLWAGGAISALALLGLAFFAVLAARRREDAPVRVGLPVAS